MLCIITLLTQTWCDFTFLINAITLHQCILYTSLFCFFNEGNSPSMSQKKISLGTSQVALNPGQWIQELEHKRMMDVISIHPSISITFSFNQGHRGFDSLSLLLLGEQTEHPVQVIS